MLVGTTTREKLIFSPSLSRYCEDREEKAFYSLGNSLLSYSLKLQVTVFPKLGTSLIGPDLYFLPLTNSIKW